MNGLYLHGRERTWSLADSMRTIPRKPGVGWLGWVIISGSIFVAHLGHMLFPVGRVNLLPEGVEERVLGSKNMNIVGAPENMV